MNTILTLDEIEDALANSRTRGGYLPVIRDFFESGELALDMTDKFPGKEVANLRNVATQNADKVKDHPPYKVVVMQPEGTTDAKDKHVLLINLDAVAAARNASDDASDDASE